MISRPSVRRVHKPVKQCFSCTQHLTCSTTGPSTRVCKCCNSGWQCTGCYCWGRCNNRGWLMPSPTTARSLPGHFLRIADLPTVNQRDSPPPIWLPTFLSLCEILATGAGGGGVRGSAGRHNILRDSRGGGRGAGGGSRDRRGEKRGGIWRKQR